MDLDLGLSNVELAKRFGVSEGTIRYHKKRNAEKRMDGRKIRYSAVSEHSTAIENWIDKNLSANQRKTILFLYRQLKEFHKFNLSYDALRRYIRRHHPEILDIPYHLRVETPPGKLSQVDWKERVLVQLIEEGNWIEVNFLIILLCFSRRPAVVVQERKDQQSFLSAHSQGVKRLGGITEYYRPDCMATAVKVWNGKTSQMTDDYQRFLKDLGAHAFPARPGTPTDKGKVEKKIQDIFRDIDFSQMVFRDLKHLQEFLDQKVDQYCQRTVCPATGTTITEAYEYEKKHLKQLPARMPEIPVQTTMVSVQKGSLAYYKGNYYQIPEGYVGKKLRCVNTGISINFYHQGKLLDSFSYDPRVSGMVRMSKAAAMSSKQPMSDLTKSWWLEVSERQLEYYQEISGAAS